MEATELNPQKCRVLRANDRQIRLLSRQKNDLEDRLTDERSELERNISEKRAKLAALKKTQALALGTSLVPGARIGLALRTGGNALEVTSAMQISVLEGQIKALQSKIDLGNEKIRRIREERRTLSEELKINAQHMNELRCVI